MLVTTESLFRRKVVGLLPTLPALEHVIVVGGRTTDGRVRVWAYDDLLAGADERFEIGPTAADDAALVHFTSGTTDDPKGAVHVHEAVVVHHASARVALDLQPDDVFWCTADPGWVTGTSYGIIAPLTPGATSVVDEDEFDADRWYRILAAQRVSVWYTSPTALRLLMRAGDDIARRHDLGALRVVASVGEALDRSVVAWGERTLGRPILDTWWQTETGGIMIANRPGEEIRPGSMGRPLPGVEAAILATGADGRARLSGGSPSEITTPGTTGELALRIGWPSMFRGYLDDEERYARCFAGGWYLTGDLASHDADGYFWFVGRADDLITSAGHLIAPVEVERAFRDHPAVADIGVIGAPDPIAGEVVKAFVTLRSGFLPDRRAPPGPARLGADPARLRAGATGGLVRRRAPAHGERQGDAPASEGPGRTIAGGRFAMTAAIRTVALSKAYGKVDALRDLDLEVAAGQVIGYLGPNGAGKTTTIRLLLGLIRPSAGRAEIFGLDCHDRPVEVHRRLAYVPSEANLWPALTGAETLHLLGRLHGTVDSAYRDDLVARFEFDPDKRVRAYSKGNRQKLILIAALMTRRRAAPPRRADLRPRPADGAGVPPLRAGSPRPRSDGVPVVTHPERGRSAVRPGGDPAGGSPRRSRHPRGDATPLGGVRRGGVRRHAARRRGGPRCPRSAQISGHRLTCQVVGTMEPLLAVLVGAGVRHLLSREPSLEEVFLSHYGDQSPAAHDAA